jgi:hypothetical protein
VKEIGEWSEHWLRVMLNKHTNELNRRITHAFGWREIHFNWRLPIDDDDNAEYYAQKFLDRLGVINLIMPLEKFWPKGGPLSAG